MPPKLEPLLHAGLDRSQTTSQKAAWFGTLRSVATTPETVTWLERVWRRDVVIPDLPLSESDEADLALDLAVRDVPTRPKSCRPSSSASRTRTARRASRSSGRPCRPIPAVREAFFASLKDVTNRRHEAWVLEAARYLHHPLRAAASKKLVIDALGLVLEIQRRATSSSRSGGRTPRCPAISRRRRPRTSGSSSPNFRPTIRLG